MTHLGGAGWDQGQRGAVASTTRQSLQSGPGKLNVMEAVSKPEWENTRSLGPGVLRQGREHRRRGGRRGGA